MKRNAYKGQAGRPSLFTRFTTLFCTKKMKTPTVAYFAEEDGQIFLRVREDSIGYWQFRVSPEKALDLAAEALRMATEQIKRRNRMTGN